MLCCVLTLYSYSKYVYFMFYDIISYPITLRITPYCIISHFILSYKIMLISIFWSFLFPLYHRNWMVHKKNRKIYSLTRQSPVFFGNLILTLPEKNFHRIFVFIFYFIWTLLCVHICHDRPPLRIVYPWFLVILFFSFLLFYSFLLQPFQIQTKIRWKFF